MKFFRSKKENLLPILINRTAIFFFLMCLLTLFFYAAGTFQGFIDSTQLYLLRLSAVLGILLVIVSFCGVILALGRLVHLKKAAYLLRAGGYFLFVIFGAAAVLVVMFIIVLAEGNGT